MDKKDFLKTFRISLVNYIAIFIISTLFSNILLELYPIVWLIITVVSAFFLTYYWYFQEKPKSPLKEGFILGLVLALFTFGIELIIWYVNFGWLFFLNLFKLLQYIFIIIVPAVAAIIKKEKKVLLSKKTGSGWKDRISS